MGYAFYTFPMLKPLDEIAVVKELSQYQDLVVIEEHSKIGGLGSAMEDIFVSQKQQPHTIKFGIPDEVAPVVGSQDYMVLLMESFVFQKNLLRRIIRRCLTPI